MKNMKNLFFALVLVSSSLFATTKPVTKDNAPKVITETVGTLLEKPNFEIDNDITAQVVLMLNKNNEIVVLSVDSKNTVVTDFIKNRLNYKKLPVLLNTKNETYVLPVRITAS